MTKEGREQKSVLGTLFLLLWILDKKAGTMC